MKKITAFILCTLLIFTAVHPAVWATSVKADTEHFDDGSYLTVTYTVPSSSNATDSESDEDTVAESSGSVLARIISRLRDFFNRLFAGQSTVTRYKYCNYFDSDGELLWSVRLKGTFTYNHRKAVCVDSEIICEIKDSDWKLISSNHSQEGSSAKGSFAVRQYKLGVPLKLIEKNLTLTCDKNGNVK